jgi:hypothetical protein
MDSKTTTLSQNNVPHHHAATENLTQGKKYMAESNDVDAAMVHAVVTRLVNEKGQTHFVVVWCDNPGRFVRELWESVGSFGPQTDEDACGEWTDRLRDFRTSVNFRGVCIRTHAWSPRYDKNELHHDVLEFLRSRGLSV